MDKQYGEGINVILSGKLLGRLLYRGQKKDRKRQSDRC